MLVNQTKNILAALTALASLTVASCAQAQNTTPNNWTGPSFTEFSGVNQAGNTTGPLLGDAISWNRLDVAWGAVEPEKGVWKQEVLEKWGKSVLDLQKRNGARLLPVLDYTANWAADRSARQYDNGDTRWTVNPREDGRFDLEKLQKQKDGTYKVVESKIGEGKNLTKWPPANTADWENYVRKTVTFLRKAPYNVEYFQIWNEAHPSSSFWMGSMDDYMAKIHFPAAKIIHELGGKVVYGGWPDIATISRFPAFLDKYQAWDSIDVVDFHYFFTSGMDFMRKAADERGRKDLAIWQTEIAFTRDRVYIGNNYPRMLYWALGNNWNRKDKYKLFFFPYWSPNSPDAYGYGRALLHGSELTAHGLSLQNLSNLLQGPNLRRFDGITTTPELVHKPSENDNSLEAFAVQNRIVVAVHLDKQTYGVTDSVSLRFPVEAKHIASIERVDLVGNRLDLTDKLAVKGAGVEIQAPTKDAETSPASEWNSKGDHSRTFYVVLTQKTP